jgi:hypothetical protein
VSFAAVALCVSYQRVFIVVTVYFIMTQSGNVWIHPDKLITHHSLTTKHVEIKLQCVKNSHVSSLRVR